MPDRDYGDWEKPNTFEQGLETLKCRSADTKAR